MNDAPQLPAGAGAQWLLTGFALLRRSPLGLGALGALFGVITVALLLASEVAPALAGPLQLVNALLSPLLMAGLVWAVREVDQARPAQPGHLLRGLQEAGAARLLATLLPQLAGAVLLLALLLALVGLQDLQTLLKLVEDAQQQVEPDPALVESLPFGRMALWLLLGVVIGLAVLFFTFTALPQIVFEKRPAFDAMRRSFRACVRNLGAMLVFVPLLLITFIGISVLVQLVSFPINMLAGMRAMVMVAQVLMMAVLMPVVAGAIYAAWRQMHAPADADADAAAPLGRNGEIEA